MSYGSDPPPDAEVIPQSSGDSSGLDWKYTQMYHDKLKEFSIAEVSQAPFADLCPHGDCFAACQDLGSLFNGDRYSFDEATDSNTTFTSQDITLFGLCTNIANVSSYSKDGALYVASGFFQSKSIQYDVNKVAVGTSLCLYDTCQATRHPDQCTPLCSPLALQDDISTFNFQNVQKCISKLCENTCGLPFANQDVFGVGVLYSFAIQAILISIYGLYCLVQLFRPIRRSRTLNRFADWVVGSIGHKLDIAAVAFLATECFFTVSATVAAFRFDPLKIDPLNGYALLFIATIDFVPPIFTLLLLHSQKKTEWYNSCLVFLSWGFSTALFFMLIHNLTKARHNEERIVEARNALYTVDSCGGYSAMSLCQENGKNDPLHYMMGFFNEDNIPNVQNIWILWAYATLVLAVLLALSVNAWRKRIRSKQSFEFSPTEETREHTKRFKWPRRVVVFLMIALFYLSFGYQIRMVIKYLQMDLIDRSTEGWSFGQIVAVLMWLPLLLELFSTSPLRRLRKIFNKDEHDEDHTASSDPLLKPDFKPGAVPVMVQKPDTSVTCVSVPPSPSPLPTPLLSPSTNGPLSTNPPPVSPV